MPVVVLSLLSCALFNLAKLEFELMEDCLKFLLHILRTAQESEHFMIAMDKATIVDALQKLAQSLIIYYFLDGQITLLAHISLARTLNDFNCIEELTDGEKPSTSEQPDALAQFSHNLLPLPVIHIFSQALLSDSRHRSVAHESDHTEGVISLFGFQVALLLVLRKLFVPNPTDLPGRVLPQ